MFTLRQNLRTWTGTPLLPTKYTLDFPPLHNKVSPQNRRSDDSRNMERTHLLLRQLTISSRYLDTSSKVLDLSCSWDPSSSLYHGNLSASHHRRQTWHSQSSCLLSFSSKLHSTRGKTGPPLESWHPLPQCFPIVVCSCAMVLR